MTQWDTFTPENLRVLVETFYGRIREDPDLGPVFERVVGRSEGGWAPHLDKMTAFWCAVMLRRPGFSGNPPAAHARLPDIRPDHFVRWLALFRETVGTLYTPEAADDIATRAQAMGSHLSRACFGAPAVPPPGR